MINDIKYFRASLFLTDNVTYIIYLNVEVNSSEIKCTTFNSV